MARKNHQDTGHSSAIPHSLGGGSGPAVSVFAPLQQAVALHQEGHLEEALQIYQQVLQVQPNHAEALYLAGTATFQLGDSMHAAKLLQASLARNPDNASAHSVLANTLREQGKLEAAEKACRRALEITPDSPDALGTLGLIQQDQGELEEAVATYGRALEFSPDSAELHSNLGSVLQQTHLVDDAIISYQRALEINPGYAKAHNNLGNAYIAQERYDDAIASYERALAFEPAYALAQHVNLGNALREKKRFDESISHYRQALEIAPDSVEALNNLGNALRDQGKLEEAIECYHRAQEIDSEYPWAFSNLGILQTQQGDFDSAIENAKRAIAIDPDCIDFHTTLANALFTKGECKEALKEYNKCLQLAPGDSNVLALKAMALDESGDHDAVRELVNFDRFIRSTRFQAPAGFTTMEEFNQALVDHLRAHPTLMPDPLHKTTRSGNQTGELLVEPKGPVAHLEEMIFSAVEEYCQALPQDVSHPFLARRPERYHLTAWGVLLDTQGHQDTHNHPGGWLSGCYYISLPDVMHDNEHGEDGRIKFGEPDPFFDRKVKAETKTYRPEEGVMFLFPSFFWHQTIPFESTEQRISISFDVIPNE